MNNLVRGLNVQLSITNDERAARRNEKPRPLSRLAGARLAVSLACETSRELPHTRPIQAKRSARLKRNFLPLALRRPRRYLQSTQ